MSRYLTKQEELDLGVPILLYKSGSEAHKDEATSAHLKLFNNNVNNVYKQVHQFFNKYQYNVHNYELEDAIQDGLYELARGLWEYDYTKGSKCYTNIYYRVWKKLLVMADMSRPIPLSRTASYKLKVINKLKLQAEEEGVSVVDYVEQNTNYKRDDIVSVINASTVDSLDFKIDDGNGAGTEFRNLVPDKKSQDKFSSIEGLSLELQGLLDKLPKEEQVLICFEFGLTDQFTQESVNKILEKLPVGSRLYNTRITRILNKLKRIALEKGSVC